MKSGVPIRERICDVVAGTLGLSPDEVSADSSARNLAAWSSLAHLRLMASLERAFDLRFTLAEMVDMDSVGAIERVLRGRAVE